MEPVAEPVVESIVEQVLEQVAEPVSLAPIQTLSDINDLLNIPMTPSLSSIVRRMIQQNKK